MKKLIFMTLALVALMCSAGVAKAWNLSALQAEAAKAVPGAQSMGSSQDDMGASVGLSLDGLNYQFTLAADMECQVPDARTLDYKGHTAYFFSPMPGSSGLKILISDDKSLTILCMAG